MKPFTLVLVRAVYLDVDDQQDISRTRIGLAVAKHMRKPYPSHDRFNEYWMVRFDKGTQLLKRGALIPITELSLKERNLSVQEILAKYSDVAIKVMTESFVKEIELSRSGRESFDDREAEDWKKAIVACVPLKQQA